MLKSGLRTYNCFHDNLLDLPLHIFPIKLLVVLLEVLEDRLKASFVSNIVLFLVFVELEILRIFINGVVSQVHLQIV